jgi:hypothetical protein
VRSERWAGLRLRLRLRLSWNGLYGAALTGKKAFHTVAQYDSKVSVQVGQAAQSDSAAMKTIAFLGLTFLPATYVCVSIHIYLYRHLYARSDVDVIDADAMTLGPLQHDFLQL